jgi:hypothetical protein
MTEYYVVSRKTGNVVYMTHCPFDAAEMAESMNGWVHAYESVVSS